MSSHGIHCFLLQTTLSGEQIKFPFSPRTVADSILQSSICCRSKGAAQIRCTFLLYCSKFFLYLKTSPKMNVLEASIFLFHFCKDRSCQWCHTFGKNLQSFLPEVKDMFCAIVVTDFRFHIKTWSTHDQCIWSFQWKKADCHSKAEVTAWSRNVHTLGHTFVLIQVSSFQSTYSRRPLWLFMCVC